MKRISSAALSELSRYGDVALRATVAAQQGCLLTLRATGEDAADAVQAVEQLILSGFGEGDDKHQVSSEHATD